MIRFENLYKAYGDKVLLASASFHFPAGEKIALVGENGAGKSTLLSILTGQEAADGGRVILPGHSKPGFLPQEPNPVPEKTVLLECESGAAQLIRLQARMQELLARMEQDSSPGNLHAYEVAESTFRNGGGYELSARSCAILAGLGFSEGQMAGSPLDLSGGWRMRLELAKIFLNGPDFLILDEPTNHLDLPSLVWVESWLKGFRGTLLFVSHDRALLNRLSTMTLHLHRGVLSPYRGNFDDFVSQREQQAEQQAGQRARIQARKGELERFIQRFGAKATKARQAKSKEKQLERLAAQEHDLPGNEKEGHLSFKLPEPQRADRILFQIEGGSIGYDRPLSKGLHLQVEKGHKIAVIGANGIGKSTLLKTMCGSIPPLAGLFIASARTCMVRYAQDQAETLDQEGTVLANLLSCSELGEGNARTLLAGFLFMGDDAYKQVKVLSGGEKSRLGLACALSAPSNLLLLDEPTNHLDMKSISRLVQSLNEYQGTVVFVSHDRNFINGVCSHIFAMLPDGRSGLFEGNLDDYERLADASGFPNVLSVSREVPGLTAEAKGSAVSTMEPLDGRISEAEFKGLRKRKQKLEREIREAEQEIESLRVRLEEIERGLVAASQNNFKQLSELQSDQRLIGCRISRAEESWLLMQEELELLLAKGAASGRQI